QKTFSDLGATNPTPSVPTSRSYLKVIDVPFLTPGGVNTSPSDIVRAFDSTPATKGHFTLSGGLPRIVRNSPKSDTCTVYFNIVDSKAGRTAKILINR